MYQFYLAIFIIVGINEFIVFAEINTAYYLFQRYKSIVRFYK